MVRHRPQRRRITALWYDDRMQTSLFNLLDDAPPAPGWVEECAGRWARYSPPWRLMAQQDLPDAPWRWVCHRWPATAPSQAGEASSLREGARLAEQALVVLQG